MITDIDNEMIAYMREQFPMLEWTSNTYSEYECILHYTIFGYLVISISVVAYPVIYTSGYYEIDPRNPDIGYELDIQYKQSNDFRNHIYVDNTLTLSGLAKAISIIVPYLKLIDPANDLMEHKYNKIFHDLIGDC